MHGRAPVGAHPELDEAEDLLGLLTFAQVGVRVAERMAVGVLRKEGEDARFAAAALGLLIVGLDDRIVAEIGHRMEVEIN